MAERAPGVLISGAAGSIGAALVGAFAGAGYRVVASDCRQPSSLPLDVEFIAADLAALSSDDATLRDSLEINLVGALALAAAFADDLAGAGGAIVNIASVHASLTKSGFLAYSVSKAALDGLTRALALELAPRGVRVNEIRPGATATAMLAAGFAEDPAGYAALVAHQPAGRLVEPAEVATLALFLASPSAGSISGAAVAADGGIGVRLRDLA